MPQTLAVRPRALVTEQIYDELKRQILTCALAPGARLVEKKLCAELKVSRPSLREAFNRLAQEGLVTLKPNCGYRVTPITINRFRNLCELRQMMEGEVVALAAQRAKLADIIKMERAAPVDCRFDAEDSHMVYTRCNREFHLAVVMSVGNQLLTETILEVLEKDHQPLFYGIDINSCTSPEAMSEEHLNIVEAIGRRDGDLARDLMRRHIGAKEIRVLEALRSKGVEE